MHALRFLIAASLALALVACDNKKDHADGGDAAMLPDGGLDATTPPPDAGPMDAAVDGGAGDAATGMDGGGDAATGTDGAVDGAVADASTDGGAPPTPFTVLYYQTFEASEAWTAGGTNSSWAWGTPAGPLFTNAYSGGNAWDTNLTGDYNASEDSWVESPAIDLSAASGDVLVRMAVQYDIQACCDGAFLEVSTDAGTTWTKVGGMGDGAGWYDTSDDVWTGVHTGWHLAEIPVSGVAGMSDVRFRVHFTSNNAVQREGMVFDDFAILQGTDSSASP